MKEYEIKSNTWTSIQLVNAIKSNDPDIVTKLIEAAQSPESATNVVRTNSTNFVAVNEDSQAYKHSLLWVVPVIVKRGVERILPGSDGLVVPFDSHRLLPALEPMFSGVAEIRNLAGLIPHSAVTSMNPCELYQACRMFSGDTTNKALKFKMDMSGLSSHFPSLCFAIGTASGFNSRPLINVSHNECALKFSHLMESTLQFNIGELPENEGNVQCLPPTELSEGLYIGVKRWLQAIRETYVFHSVSLILAKKGNYRFHLFIQSDENHPVVRLEWEMKAIHVEEILIAETYRWLDAECSMPLAIKQQRQKLMH